MPGCTQETRTERKIEGSPHQYSDGAIYFNHPDWQDIDDMQKEQFMLKTGKGCVFSAARYPLPHTLFQNELKNNLDAKIDGDYATYEINGLQGRTRTLYCNYTTYAISMACKYKPDNTYLSSAGCKRRDLKTKPGLALIPIPPHDDSSLIVPAISESREAGAEVLSWYFSWYDIEDNPDVSDHIMIPLAHEGKTAVLFTIIYTNQLGKFPRGYKHFKERGFKEDFAEFSNHFISTYNPDYYLIGGEVDIYLDSHRDEIQDYKEFFKYVKEEIKKNHPDTKIGIVFTYHDAKKNDAFDIIKTLGEESDIVAYTVHAYDDNFDYSDVSRGLKQLEEAAELIPGKPYAIIETGWSSSELLGSSQAKQAEFVRDFFHFLDSSDAEFLLWFGLYEWSDCSDAADTFILGMEVTDAWRERFEEYMCSLGLKTYDALPKKAWEVWKENSGR